MFKTEPVADVSPVWDQEHDGWKRQLRQYGNVLLRVQEQLTGTANPTP